MLIIALIPILFRFAIIEPLFELHGLEVVLSRLLFFVLLLSVILMTASGYVINDYFDLRIDRVNKKPQNVFIGNQISRRSAIIFHWVLTFLSALTGVYVAWQTQFWLIAIAVVSVIALLSAYSIWLKKYVLAGNLLVAILGGLLIPLFWFVELQVAGINVFFGFDAITQAASVWFFAVFAFFTTLLRELIKDIEDYDGDLAGGRKTLAVFYGLQRAKKIALVVTILNLALLIGFVVFFVFSAKLHISIFLALFVIFPLILVSLWIQKSSNSLEFKRMQYVLKGIMVAGILSMIFHFLIPGV